MLARAASGRVSLNASLPPEREGRKAPVEILERRKQMAAAVAAGAFATREAPIETVVAGLRTWRFRAAPSARGWLLQFHGGGFRMGSPEFAARFAEALTVSLPIAVVIPQYRLAPEAPFPAGLNDALAALRALRDEIGPDAPLIVGGDSAGAGLAASLGVLAAAGEASRIDALVLLSPWLDLTVSAPAYAENAQSDPLFSRGSADLAAELYLQGVDAHHPLASPLHATLAGYPRTLISVGDGEVLRDDSLRFHRRLVESGVDARLSVVDGMEHVAVMRGLDRPGATETFEAVVEFIAGVIA